MILLRFYMPIIEKSNNAEKCTCECFLKKLTLIPSFGDHHQLEGESCSVVSDSLWPLDHTVHGILQAVYWSGWLFPSPGDLPNPGIKPRSPILQVDSLPAEPQGKPKNSGVGSLSLLQGIFSNPPPWQSSGGNTLSISFTHIQFAFPLKSAMAVHTLIFISGSQSSENLGDLITGAHWLNGRVGSSVLRPFLIPCLGQPCPSPCPLEQLFSKCGGPPASTPLSLGSLLQMQIIMPPPLESAFFFFALLCGMWDLSSLMRDWTCSSCTGSLAS